MDIYAIGAQIFEDLTPLEVDHLRDEYDIAAAEQGWEQELTNDPEHFIKWLGELGELNIESILVWRIPNWRGF